MSCPTKKIRSHHQPLCTILTLWGVHCLCVLGDFTSHYEVDVEVETSLGWGVETGGALGVGWMCNRGRLEGSSTENAISH